MIQRLRHVLVALALVFFATTHNVMAAASIFYQPQLAHMSIEDAAWSAMFKQLRRNGIDTLVFQWTRYDNAFADGEEAVWLEQRVKDAVNADLKLIIGLSADSDVFQRLNQPNVVLPAYFRKIREKDLNLVTKWQAVVPPDQLVGWYLPLEIDDKRWRLTTDQEMLANYIRETTIAINGLQKIQRPIYLSTFFTGQMSPLRYAEMTRRLHNATDAQLLVQDGAGVGTLTHAERKLYLSALTQCQSPAIQGVVYELFRQTKNKGSAFTAEPLSPATRAKTLAIRAPCKLATSYFAINYLSSRFH